MNDAKLTKRSLKQIRGGVDKLANDMGVKVRFKDEWWLMKLLGFILFFNPRFMKTVTTTIGNTVAFPTRSFIENDAQYVRVMIHELVHVGDKNKYGALPFGFLYLVPQIFAVFSLFALGAFWNLEYLYFLICLLFLAPWPSPGRVWAELRGYTMTMGYFRWYNGMDLRQEPDWIKERLPFLVQHFTGWGYYRMSWSEKATLDKLSDRVYKLKARHPFFLENKVILEIYCIFFPEEREELFKKIGHMF